MKHWMSRRLPILILSVVALMALSVASVFADQRDFTLHNNSAETVSNVYVSPASSSHWGQDILGEDTLDPGEVLNVSFSDAAVATCVWDIEVVTSDGAASYLYKEDLCSTSDVYFHD